MPVNTLLCSLWWAKHRLYETTLILLNTVDCGCTLVEFQKETFTGHINWLCIIWKRQLVRNVLLKGKNRDRQPCQSVAVPLCGRFDSATVAPSLRDSEYQFVDMVYLINGTHSWLTGSKWHIH